jgi:hypothetical protein
MVFDRDSLARPVGTTVSERLVAERLMARSPSRGVVVRTASPRPASPRVRAVGVDARVEGVLERTGVPGVATGSRDGRPTVRVMRLPIVESDERVLIDEPPRGVESEGERIVVVEERGTEDERGAVARVSDERKMLSRAFVVGEEARGAAARGELGTDCGWLVRDERTEGALTLGADRGDDTREADDREPETLGAEALGAATRGAEARGADTRGAETRGAEARGADTRGAEPRVAPRCALRGAVSPRRNRARRAVMLRAFMGVSQRRCAQIASATTIPSLTPPDNPAPQGVPCARGRVTPSQSRACLDGKTGCAAVFARPRGTIPP